MIRVKKERNKAPDVESTKDVTKLEAVLADAMEALHGFAGCASRGFVGNA